MLKAKRDRSRLGFQVFDGEDGNRYLVFRSLDGSFHVFTEVEATEAAKQCGAVDKGNTRSLWESLWEEESPAASGDAPAGDALPTS
jgi:hypothetical protein